MRQSGSLARLEGLPSGQSALLGGKRVGARRQGSDRLLKPFHGRRLVASVGKVSGQLWKRKRGLMPGWARSGTTQAALCNGGVNLVAFQMDHAMVRQTELTGRGIRRTKGIATAFGRYHGQQKRPSSERLAYNGTKSYEIADK